MTFPPALFALGVVLIASADYDPQTLTLRWPDGRDERMAATSPATCQAAVRAIERGLWRPVGDEPVSATCAPGDLFSARSKCIKGFNCGGLK
jgi:hypothetical protein